MRSRLRLEGWRRRSEKVAFEQIQSYWVEDCQGEMGKEKGEHLRWQGCMARQGKLKTKQNKNKQKINFLLSYNIHIEKCINHIYTAWWILTKWTLPCHQHPGQEAASRAGRADLKHSGRGWARGLQRSQGLRVEAGEGGQLCSVERGPAWLLPL